MTNCLCTQNYECEDCIERKQVNRLTPMNKVKLKMYKKHLEEENTNDNERNELILYMIDHDLDSSLIKYL